MRVWVYDHKARPLKPVPIEAVEQRGGKLVDPKYPTRVFYPWGENVWWFASKDAAYKAAIAQKRQYVRWAEERIKEAQAQIEALEAEWSTE
jgi:hypothetical protein